MKEVRLKVPVTAEDLAGLELGTVVHLDGVIYTGREGLYKRILDDGVPPPVELASVSNVNFHCSPAAAVGDDGSYRVGAVTATASFRFAKWLGRWFPQSGCKVIIGKGGMTEEDYRTHFVPNGAVYLTTVGYGTGALLGRGIKRVRDVFWLDELGIAQAMWVFEVERLGPFLVESDLQGNGLFDRATREINTRVDGLYAGLKPPALSRYGETTRRTDDVI
ncbi:fumarate hydratase C-terminal domain-containing protein [Azospirillum sp. ST 5-10]|uniref:fumarate hydratase C-terminal domain-containing protein n=1 Tax=unclassified Azospirillum TaxID=2630922 RepID=UPI003F4A334E